MFTFYGTSVYKSRTTGRKREERGDVRSTMLRLVKVVQVPVRQAVAEEMILLHAKHAMVPGC